MHSSRRSASRTGCLPLLRSSALSVATVSAVVGLAACGGSEAGGGESGGGSEPITLTGVTAAPPGGSGEALLNWFSDELEERTDGQVVVDWLPSGALCAAPEVVVCVQDGRADIGVSVPDYTPQLFPDASIVGIPFLNQDHQAITESLYQLHQEHEGAQALYDQNNLKYLSTWSVGRLLFGSDEPLDSYEDLEGLRMRLSNPLVMEAGAMAGAENVAVTAAETYEAVERGLADGVGFSIDGILNFRLGELLDYWSDPGTGHYSTFAMWMNQDVFQELPEDAQTAIEEIVETMNTGAGTEVITAVIEQQCAEIQETFPDLQFNAWPEEATEAWREELGASLEETWLESAAANGLEDPEAYLQRYKELLEQAGNSGAEDPVVGCLRDLTA